VVPNKRLEDLMRAFAYYRRFVDHRSRLILVGEYRGFMPYYDALQGLAGRLGLDEVIFPGHVSQAELNAYYRVADCFVCASEHEGFCVPLFEAMYREVPVVAYSAAAIPYSTGGGVLLLEDKDPAILAETVGRVTSDPELRRRLLARQRRSLAAVEPERLVRRLLDDLHEAGLLPAAAGPGGPAAARDGPDGAETGPDAGHEPADRGKRGPDAGEAGA